MLLLLLAGSPPIGTTDGMPQALKQRAGQRVDTSQRIDQARPTSNRTDRRTLTR